MVRIPILAGLLAFATLLMGAGPAAAQNRFYLVNGSGQVIQEAYVSPSRISEWGPDILGAGVLPVGNQVWVTPNFPDCVLDVRVRYANGTDDTRMQVNACNISRVVFGGGGVAPVAPGAAIGGGPGYGRATTGNPSFTIVNGTGTVIREIYSSLSSQRDWGPDRLGANTLQPGGSLFIPLPQGGGCTADIRVVYMNGAANERRGVETCSIQQLTWR
ncbi:Tat pathway signal protein [Plastoroseomonas arctica]|uniref:Tat pathway signal protein n=1 Tax=Plastoroseomonas arctica TaxID=1509237 RepID=A0AAF1K0S7_9PROT|nr:Tat pathway signal protein [Plastoroseomonas arctica]MBR0656903.1 Tat pathway signal protein [Plastoroseomonas arctica]